MSKQELRKLAIESIGQLEVERGILASSKDDLFGCLFGRDSLITALKLLRADEYAAATDFLPLVKKILVSLADLQGTDRNIESGEEVGKIIHEYRPDNHEHLTLHNPEPWYVYPDGSVRNYDTVDATPLFLMAMHRYVAQSQDTNFLRSHDRHVRSALGWLSSFEDQFVTFSFLPERTFGGVRIQSWMDSTESMARKNGWILPPYPIAPLEVQAYAWAAFRMWASYYAETDPEYAQLLRARANYLKGKFNTHFVTKRANSFSLAFAIDGWGRKMTAPRSSMGHLLWASFDGESILNAEHVQDVARRLLARDMFVAGAGIRTLSSRSSRFDPHSYHNGSIWPHDTAIAADGLHIFGYKDEAARVRSALINSMSYFKSPVELYTYKRGLTEFEAPWGQRACRVQAWSAAGLLAVLAHPDEVG